MTPSRDRSRALGVGASVGAVAVVATWALARSRGPLAGPAGLAGIVGILTFASSLTPALATRRYRTMATGLVLVGAAVVVAAMSEGVGARTVTAVVAGPVLFWAAETGDRALAGGGGVETRRGTDRWGTVSVLGVAAGSAAFSYGLVSVRGALSGGGAAALAAGTAAAVLVAGLTTLVLRGRYREGA